MKAHFDIERSIKECPPEKIFVKYDGYRFKKRIVVNTDKLHPKKENQVRDKEVVQKGAATIAESFKTDGWIHSKEPIVCTVNPLDKESFEVEWGFTRNQAATMLEWETMIIDVAEKVGSPLDVFADKFICNKHEGSYFTPMNKFSYSAALKKAVDNKWIKDDKKELQSFLKKICSKNDKERKKIYEDYLNMTASNGPTKTWHTGKGLNSVEEYALAHDLPFSGDKNYKRTSKLAYMTYYADVRKILGDAEKLWSEYKKPVNIVSYLEVPNAAPALYQQRSDHLRQVETAVNTKVKFIVDFMKELGVKNVDTDKVRKTYMAKVGNIGSFLWQNQEPDESNGGKPTEQGIVDINGKLKELV